MMFANHALKGGGKSSGGGGGTDHGTKKPSEKKLEEWEKDADIFENNKKSDDVWHTNLVKILRDNLNFDGSNVTKSPYTLFSYYVRETVFVVKTKEFIIETCTGERLRDFKSHGIITINTIVDAEKKKNTASFMIKVDDSINVSTFVGIIVKRWMPVLGLFDSITEWTHKMDVNGDCSEHKWVMTVESTMERFMRSTSKSKTVFATSDENNLILLKTTEDSGLGFDIINKRDEDLNKIKQELNKKLKANTGLFACYQEQSNRITNILQELQK